jgi:hypothetical protein
VRWAGQVRWGGISRVERIDKIIQGSSKKGLKTYSSAKAWLGGDCRMITKDSGDVVLISKDGLRKLRFDTENPHGDLPHMHLEVLKNGEWEDALIDVHRLYPKN